MGLVQFKNFYSKEPVWIHTNELDDYIDDLESLQSKDEEVARLKKYIEGLQGLLMGRENAAIEANKQRDALLAKYEPESLIDEFENQGVVQDSHDLGGQSTDQGIREGN